MILVCGEALIDLFAAADDAGGMVLKAAVGGSPFNVAVGLARLGVATGFFGAVSTDGFGDQLAAAMTSASIDITLLKRTSRPTSLVLVRPDADGHPTYVFYGQWQAEADVLTADLPPALPPAVEAIALGSYVLGQEPVSVALLTLAAREGAQRVVSIDINLRRSMNGALADWRARIDAFLTHATIVKLSEEDLIGGWGADADPGALAAWWLQQGAKLIVMTRGGEGATAWNSAGRVDTRAGAVAVVDTVGAGDSFHAALLARLAQTGQLSHAALATLDRAAIQDLLAYATAVAALVCARRGADMPSRADVDAALATAV